MIFEIAIFTRREAISASLLKNKVFSPPLQAPFVRSTFEYFQKNVVYTAQPLSKISQLRSFRRCLFFLLTNQRLDINRVLFYYCSRAIKFVADVRRGI